MKTRVAKSIFVSIKPEFIQKIISKEKNHEFRNYYPKTEINRLYIYETVPVKELKYIIDLKNIIKYPNKITTTGYGNKEFNLGKKTKYAYEIKNLFAISIPISLQELKEKYHFTLPQAYAYDNKYPELTNYIEKIEKRKIY